MSQASGIAAQFGINIPSSQNEIKWELSEVIKSRTLLRKIIEKKFNSNMYGNDKQLIHILTNSNEQKNKKFKFFKN